MSTVAVWFSVAPAGACAFRGYEEKPDASSKVPVSSLPGWTGNLSAFIYAMPDDRAQRLWGALEAVARTFADETFRRRVNDAEGIWLATPRAQASGASFLNGDDVLAKVVDAQFGDVHFFAERIFRANAATAICPGRIRVEKYIVDNWDSDDPDLRADSLNTLSHELTHLVPRSQCDCTNEKPCESLVLDRGHDDCDDTQLVSYRIGDMVECHYRFPQPKDDDAFTTCVKARRPRGGCGCAAEIERLHASASPTPSSRAPASRP